jgi:hypothetical protein
MMMSALMTQQTTSLPKILKKKSELVHNFFYGWLLAVENGGLDTPQFGRLRNCQKHYFILNQTITISSKLNGNIGTEFGLMIFQ